MESACWGEVPHGVAIVRDGRLLTARNVLIDIGLRRLPGWELKLQFEERGDGEPVQTAVHRPC